MGGYGNLNEADVNDSKKYLNDIWGNQHVKNLRVLDCGSGIGRISKELLIHYFSKCDLVE